MEATDDDILNKQNALISKAVRTLGLRLLPGDILEECMDAVIETQRSKDAVDPDAAKRKIFDSFGTVGVQVKDLQEYLGHPGETLTPKELTDLRGLYSALKDGETSWREIMDSKAAADAAPPKNPLFAKKTDAKVAEQVAPPPKTPAVQNGAKAPLTREQKLDAVIEAFKVQGLDNLCLFLIEKRWLAENMDLRDMGSTFVDKAFSDIPGLKAIFSKWQVGGGAQNG